MTQAGRMLITRSRYCLLRKDLGSVVEGEKRFENNKGTYYNQVYINFIPAIFSNKQQQKTA